MKLVITPLLVGMMVMLVLRMATPSHANLQKDETQKKHSAGAQISENARRMINEGRHTFRLDTFGDEDFWGATFKLQQAIAGATLGGVGPGMSPKTAVALGLKVDLTTLPSPLRNQLQQGQVNLDAPATTLALLKLNAVVG